MRTGLIDHAQRGGATVYPPVRRIICPLAAFLLALTLTLLPGIITSRTTFAANGHGCAPATPPSIPGAPAPAPAVANVIVINEVLLSPHSTWNCSETSGTYFATTDSWIELYNTQNQPYNLYSAHAFIDSGPTQISIFSPSPPLSLHTATSSFSHLPIPNLRRQKLPCSV